MMLDSALLRYLALRFCKNKCECSDNDCKQCTWKCPVIGYIQYIERYCEELQEE